MAGFILIYLAVLTSLAIKIPGGDITLKDREESVIVIGAGVSGLAAARRLQQHGYRNVTILEANDRIGGRVNTIAFDADRFIELGAQFVHGEEGNSVYALAVEHGLMSDTQVHQGDPVFLTDKGAIVDRELGTNILNTVNDLLANVDVADEARYTTVQDYLDSKLLEFLASNPTLDKGLTESIWRTSVAGMRIDTGCDSYDQMNFASLSEFRRSDGNNLGLLKRGYLPLVQVLAKDIPKEFIKFRQAVTLIDTNQGAGVRVLTKDGTVYHVDHVILTVSLGVLKVKAREMFIPSLPTRKLDAYQALGFGTVDKVFFEFENAFWDAGWRFIALVWTEDTVKSESSLKKDLVLFDVVSTTNNTMVAWLSGEAARKMEVQTDEEIISCAVDVLKRFTKRQSLPKVLSMRRSRWYSDENFKGSYSFRTIQSNSILGLNDTLSEPLYGRTSSGQQNSPVVMFAGEHTHPYYYSTVHSALDSGEREADRLIQFYKGVNRTKY